MKSILQRIGIFGATVVLAGAFVGGAQAHAIDVFTGGCKGVEANGKSTGSSSICGAGDSEKGDDFNTIAKNIINTLLYVVGIVAVVMIIIGGIRYASSNGDSSSIQGAKNTILYAVIGLIVAIMAFAIVNFVVGRFGGSSGGGGSSNNSGTPATPRDTGTVTEN